MEKKQKIETKFHSEDLHEVITKPPSWLLKSGISLIFIFTMLSLGMTYFIEVPETAQSSISFMPRYLPEIVSSKVKGNLKLLVKDGSIVAPDDTLGYVDSTHSYAALLYLLAKLKAIQSTQNTIDLAEIELPTYPSIGELQLSFDQLRLLLVNLKKTKLAEPSHLTLGLQQDVQIPTEIIELQNEYKAKELRLKLIEQSNGTYDSNASKKLNEQLAVEIRKNMELITRNIGSLNKILINNKRALIQDKSQKKIVFFTALSVFIDKGDQWIENHSLVSNIAGRLTFVSPLQENQLVGTKQQLFFIKPTNNQYIGKIKFPENVRRKIVIGQEVQIKLKGENQKKDSYLTGKILNIEKEAIGNQVYANVSIDSNSKDRLTKIGTATMETEVIINRSSMLEKIWHNILKSNKMQ